MFPLTDSTLPDAVMEMNEQIEQLSKMKTKVEQDKNKIMAEIADVRAATDEVNRSKASAEKSYKNLLNGLNELNKKIEETNLNLGDLEAGKRRVTAENADTLRQLQELQNNASLLVKTRSGLANALDEAKAVCDHEAKERVSLLGKYRNLEHELDGLKQVNLYYDIVIGCYFHPKHFRPLTRRLAPRRTWPGRWGRRRETPTCGDRSTRSTGWPGPRSWPWLS